MSNRDQVQRVLAELGRSVGLTSLAIGADESCALLFDDSLRVDIVYDEAGERLIFSARLGPLPHGDSSNLKTVLLRMNGFWRDFDVSMGLDPVNGEVVQVRQLPAAGLELTRFQNALAGFVVAAESNARLVSGAEVVAKADTDAPTYSLADFAIRV